MLQVAEQAAESTSPFGILADDGTLVEGHSLEEPPELLLSMLRWMVLGRAFDRRMFNLQRQGRLGTYAPIAGQEATLVGCGLALRDGDWFLGSYRDGLTAAIHGKPLEHIPHFYSGHPKTGIAPAGVHAPPLQVSVADQIPHAVGIAWGMKLRRAGTASLVLFGDGATSEGAFHDAANFAGVLHVPAVLICQNNGWAISVPRSSQTAATTIAQKAIAYGMPGEMVDGNDAVAVYRRVSRALERARSGGGPTLIEAITYRVGPHTTSDDPTRYRPAEELALWQNWRDPISRLRSYLEQRSLWSSEHQAALEEETNEEVGRIVQSFLNEPPPAPEAIFDHVYAVPPPHLQEQRDILTAHIASCQEKGA
jgi:pyruvate dehydrogenase E1 component alpha subunit